MVGRRSDRTDTMDRPVSSVAAGATLRGRVPR